MRTATEQAKAIIAARGGTIRTRDAIAAGIHPRTLYALRDEGALQRLGRGLYRLADLPPVGDPDLALVAGRISRAVVCLISALSLHELTTQIPHAIHIALPRSARYPVLADVPLAVYRYSEESYGAGIEHQDLGGMTIPVYDAEKTLADCFKFRHKIGIDLFLEGLARHRRRRGASMQRILEYARINRVDNLIRPYLEVAP